MIEPCARRSAKRRRPRKPFADLDGEKWLIVRNGEFAAWTNAEVLRRNGFNPERIAALAARKFKLNEPAEARPFLAADFLARLIVDGEFVHDAGEA
jgi:hypothetical protein